MLNELYQLSKSLEHYGLLQPTTHPEVGSVGKAACMVVEVDASGVPRGLHFLPKNDNTVCCWRHSKGNHNGFPAIRVQKPILAEEESKKIDDALWKNAGNDEKWKMLGRLDFSAINPECTDIKISEWSAGRLGPVLLSDDPQLAALRQLISVFPREGGQQAFLRQLAQLVGQKAKSDDMRDEKDVLDQLKALLVGSFDEEKQRQVSGVMTYYDVRESFKYDNAVPSAKTQDALIRLLNSQAALRGPKNAENTIISPFSGEKTAGVGDKYPNPSMPLLGPTYLYSKKSDIPCLKRYGMAGAQAFQAGADEISAINDALDFLTAPARKNKTWCPMGDSSREKTNLLLAYLPDSPQNDALLAKCLSSLYDYDISEETRTDTEGWFENLGQQVIGELEHVVKRNPDAVVNLILLETLDKGRKQVGYKASLTADWLCKNLLEWNAASKNIPPVKLWVEKSPAVTPICPGPNEICQMFKINYISRRPMEKAKQSGVSLHQIYSLYMPDSQAEQAQLAEHFISLAVKKSRLLLTDIGQQLIAKKALPKNRQWQALARQAAMFVSLLSILLYFMGIRREKYMIDMPFNLGQLLKLADMLHKEYSMHERKAGSKEKPFQAKFMGNEMLSIVAETPVEGLCRLRERIQIYVAWALRTVGEHAGRAKWVLARLEEVSRKIASAEGQIPEQFAPAQQAQVLLGYLADIPYEKNDKSAEKAMFTEEEDNSNE